MKCSHELAFHTGSVGEVANDALKVYRAILVKKGKGTAHLPYEVRWSVGIGTTSQSF